MAESRKRSRNDLEASVEAGAEDVPANDGK